LLGAVVVVLLVVVVEVDDPAAAAASEAADESVGAPLSATVVVVVEASDWVVDVSAFLQPPSPRAKPAVKAIASIVRLIIINPPNSDWETTVTAIRSGQMRLASLSRQAANPIPSPTRSDKRPGRRSRGRMRSSRHEGGVLG
jgi:hypothetical protein